MAIYPKEIIDFTYEVVHKKHKVNSGLLYKIILLLIFVVGIGLPFVIIDVSANSVGVIETNLLQYKIKTQSSGRILMNAIVENASVNKGDTLLVIETFKLRERINILENELRDKVLFMEDLKYLVEGNPINVKSDKYIEDYELFESNIKMLKIKILNNKQKYSRKRKLYKSNVISKSEYEGVKYSYSLSKQELDRHIEENTNRWAREVEVYATEVSRIRRELSALEEQIEKSVLIAPINGSINNYKKIEKGSVVFVNQEIAEISPQGNLIAELYIKPQDVGLVSKNMKVKLQVDAFNYNQWGVVNGRLTEVSNDVIIINQIPVFKAKCKLEKDYLTLKNGYKGYLKKGMNIRGHIKITERSLYDLLYDKIDDWVNPNRSS